MKMMIEQEDRTWQLNIEVDHSYFRGEWYVDLTQGKGCIKIKKEGAKELIKVLQELVDEND